MGLDENRYSNRGAESAVREEIVRGGGRRGGERGELLVNKSFHSFSTYDCFGVR